MTDEYTTREDAGGQRLLEAISLYGQLQAVRIALRKHVNNLTRSVEERKQLYAELRAKEDDMKDRIAQLLPHLSPEDVQQLKEKYESGLVRA
jgi:peptidoglycan hydrolase CwlO-like protein